MNRVWIIDDDTIASAIAKHLLGRHQAFELMAEFTCGADAVDVLQNGEKQHPDVILLDLNMPVMSGWEFLDFLSENSGLQSIPVVIFTSSIDPRDRLRARDYPVVIGHFVKPIDMGTLNEINSLLNRR
ncbi:MAG: response regulator [Cryomorphaceae bacterium]|nr:MAG: response regulator [Cryomorphaceae bacterium]